MARVNLSFSLPRNALSIAELDGLDHGGVVRFVRALEQSGHRMVWIPEVNGREAFTTAALVLGVTERMVVGNGVARALERVPKSAASAAQDLAAGYPGRYVLGLGVSGAARERGTGPLPFLRDYLDGVDETIVRRGGAEVPRVLGAYSAGITRLAAERADGLITFLVTPETPAGRARRSARICSCRSSGGQWWAGTAPRPARWPGSVSPTT